MSALVSELQTIGEELIDFTAAAECSNVNATLSSLEDSVKKVGASWSGSWIGYHALVYYDGLRPPPAGATFSVEWGLNGLSRFGSRGEWRQFSSEEVKEIILNSAARPDLSEAERMRAAGTELFQTKREEVVSILHSVASTRKDAYLNKLLEEAGKIRVFTKIDFVDFWKPKGQLVSRDSGAVLQGLTLPPHLDILADVHLLRDPMLACKELGWIASNGAAHIARMDRNDRRAERTGTNVFIGHGRSSVWKDLKDFTSERLCLPWDEFNRVPVAGITNIARLSEMLDAASIGFIILTAEDEQADGKLHARMNAVHEAGLFQGRLGFTRAIVLLEEGCEEFSNIQGLGQIRFPKGNVGAVFEEIRRVLEREGIIES
jgi:hypothetical protein